MQRQVNSYRKKLTAVAEAGLLRIPNGRTADAFVTEENLPRHKRVIDEADDVLRRAKKRRVLTACCNSKNRAIHLGSNVWFCSECHVKRLFPYLTTMA